ncbi:hypothetical protein D3C84_879780 [compost metagenome]
MKVPMRSSGKPSFSNVSRGISTGTRQWLHSLRARRWAMIRLTEVAILKPWMPMLCRRVRVSAALLVCRVDSTRCPVWAALMAISAVSRSRISPTMITSGS